MNLYLDELVDGLEYYLGKQGSELFTIPSGSSLFPNLTSQAKWQYAKGQDFLRLHDGQKVYSFRLPTGMSEHEDFAATQEQDMDPSQFHAGATTKGLAQVHRADPGSIYFTLQEGRNNPTFTLKHQREDSWRGTPKTRKTKEAVVPNVDMPALVQGIKEAFDKQASMEDTLASAARGTHRALFAPGEITYNIGDGDNFIGGLGTAGLGAGIGAAYHLGRRHLYNTPEENLEEDEQGLSLPLKRMGIPAFIAGALGAGQSSLFENHYKDLKAGVPQP